MYAGHFGVALAAKGACREEPLSTLVLASVATDLIVSGLDLAGVGLPSLLNPHSIPGTAVLCLTFGLVILLVTRSARRGAFVGSLVLLHTLADYVTSSLPTWPGGPRPFFNPRVRGPV